MPSQSRLQRSPYVAAALTAVAVGITSAALAFWFYNGRRRKRAANAAARSKAGGPSLAEELREALRREAEQGWPALDAALEADFQAAVSWVGDNGSELSNSAKLALYGCYKQVIVGDSPPDCPRGIEASMKWNAWRENAGIPRVEAMRKYVATLRGSVSSWVPPSGTSGPVVKPATVDEAEGGMTSLGPSVSTLGRLGEQDAPDDVDETPVGQLNEMIHQGDVAGALAVLRSAPDLAVKADKDGMTPLHWAADRGCDKVMDALLSMLGGGPEAASHLNACDHNGDTALHYAIMAESEESAKRLFRAGADVHICNEDGETPLALAEAQGWEKLFDKKNV